MAELQPLGKMDGLGRWLYLLQVSDFHSLPETLGKGGQFAALVLGDATGVGSPELNSFAMTLVNAGAAYVCAWGPRCRSVEDAVDYAAVEQEKSSGVERPVIMTTSHAEDSLEDAIEFFLKAAFPAEERVDACKTSIAITVGNLVTPAEVISHIEALT